jgi:hypothetical protein
MDNIAVQSSENRLDLCQKTASQRNLSALVIEKDFWVCWTLKQMFTLLFPGLMCPYPSHSPARTGIIAFVPCVLFVHFV